MQDSLGIPFVLMLFPLHLAGVFLAFPPLHLCVVFLFVFSPTLTVQPELFSCRIHWDWNPRSNKTAFFCKGETGLAKVITAGEKMVILSILKRCPAEIYFWMRCSFRSCRAIDGRRQSSQLPRNSVGQLTEWSSTRFTLWSDRPSVLGEPLVCSLLLKLYQIFRTFGSGRKRNGHRGRGRLGEASTPILYFDITKGKCPWWSLLAHISSL